MTKEPKLWEGNETVWHAWEPECDSCGRGESSLRGKQLLSCSGCLVSKYCSKEFQKKDWGENHKNQCHLSEANSRAGHRTVTDTAVIYTAVSKHGREITARRMAA
ncbi:hypothetical protein FB45DRAFT_253404 [Roridomyces roridus]|uniref:MYND-type domain-containing protein n=1 Tax=Roridomyces roridus TaxID=1738132 RepID=A0AAD7B8Y1_9AGAR|nr:hypothetical protein FB45DRAFT_253404 [Roridomyces roridus]